MIKSTRGRHFELVLQVGVVYLWYLAKTDDLSSFIVHSKKHGSSLRQLSLEQFQGLI